MSKSENWGGRRAGAGRKPKYEAALSQVVQARLSDLQAKCFKSLGGADWLRNRLDSTLLQQKAQTDVPEIKPVKVSTRLAVNVFDYAVQAGFPSPAESYASEVLDFNELLVDCEPATFVVRAKGESMIEAGIAEANGAGVAAGLAAAGKKVFFHSFGTFSSRRCYDLIYMSAAYAGLPVHVLGSDAGVTAAFNGGTHMPLEDAAMYLSIPETVVLDPADYAQLECITRQLPGITSGVTYTRFVRKGIVKVSEDGSEFPIGKGVVLHESDKDVATIITSGIMVDESLKAYEALQAEGISVRVNDMFTWKPLDEELVIKAAKETGAIVTAENHNVTCGLGSVVSNCLAKNCPTVQEFVGVQDLFGQVGPQDFLMDEYGLRAANIVAAVKKAISRK